MDDEERKRKKEKGKGHASSSTGIGGTIFEAGKEVGKNAVECFIEFHIDCSI